MSEKKIKLWMPVTKSNSTGEYFAALSDNSIDRDDEMVAPELLKSWAMNNSLPALADHNNSMEKWIGGWTELKVVQKDGMATLFAKPWFFSKEANPLAGRIQKQVDEALAKGLNAGISIGAIVHDAETRKFAGKDIRTFTKGELLEATWVPIQSNRNASYGHVAKKYGLEEVTKPKQVENCVRELMSDPDFKPQNGKTKEESAWAVCQANQKKHIEVNNVEESFTKKDLDSAVEKKEVELKAEFDKTVETKDAEISKLNKELTEKAEKVESVEKELTEVKEALEKEKAATIEKQKFAEQGGEEEEKPEDVDKAMSEGKLPLMRG